MSGREYVSRDELNAALVATARGIGVVIREAVAHPPSPAERTLSLQMAHVCKFASDGKRVIRGVASTDSLDLQGDVVVPSGGTWQLPLPLLWQHDHKMPIGWVRELSVSRDALNVVAEVASGIEQADNAWKMVESQLVSAFSIGFIGMKGAPIATGMRWTAWKLIELSVVTIPANPDARITATRTAAGSVKLKSTAGSVKLRSPRA